jgi:hypothetical protein
MISCGIIPGVVVSPITSIGTGLVDSGLEEGVGAEGSYSVCEEFIDGARLGKSGSSSISSPALGPVTVRVGSTTGVGATGATATGTVGTMGDAGAGAGAG